MVALCANCVSIQLNRAVDLLSRFQQISACSDATCDPHLQLAELDTEVARVGASAYDADRLAQIRILFKKKINSRSPLVKLPVELSAEIFHSCVDWSVKEQSMTPWCLGRICGALRHITQSTPHLWTSVSITLSQDRIEAQTLAIEEWLVRSSDRPISIRLECSNDAYWHTHWPTSILDAVASCSERWHRVDLILPLAYFNYLAVTKERLPLLSSISLRPAGETLNLNVHAEMMVVPMDTFKSAPKLREVHLYRDFSPYMIALPWEQLTRLWGQSFFVHECLDVLRRAPNLEYCAFNRIPFGAQAPSDPAATTGVLLLPHLKALVVDYRGKLEVGQLLDSIMIPSAREIEFRIGGARFPRETLISLIARSSCRLKRLCLTVSTLSEDDLVVCLRLMPSLVDFKLDVRGMSTDDPPLFTNNLIQRLHAVNLDGLLPELEAFAYLGPASFSDEALECMLATRWHSVSGSGPIVTTRLKSFTMEISSEHYFGPSKHVEDSLRKMVGGGMRISIVNTAYPASSWL